MIQGWGESVASAIRAVPAAWDTFIAGLAVAFLKVEEFGANFMAVVATIPENLSRIGNYIANNWRELITDALAAVGTAFGNLGSTSGSWARRSSSSSRTRPRASSSTGRRYWTASRRPPTSSPSS